MCLMSFFLSLQVLCICWGLSWYAEPSKMFILDIFTICSLKRILVCTGPVKYFTDFVHLFWQFSNTGNNGIPCWQQCLLACGFIYIFETVCCFCYRFVVCWCLYAAEELVGKYQSLLFCLARVKGTQWLGTYLLKCLNKNV